MIDPTVLHILLPQVAAAAGLSLVGAAVAERLGGFRWLGGLAVGLLLSGAVLGQLAPGLHGRLFIGGVDEQRALDARRLQVEADVRALDATRVSRGHVEAMAEEWMAGVEAGEKRVEAIRARYAAVLDGWATAAALMLAFACGAGARLRRWMPSFVDAAPLALAAAAAAGGGVLIAIRIFGRPDPGGDASLAFAALLLAVVCGSTPLARSWASRCGRRADDRGAASATDDQPDVAQSAALLLALAAMIGLAMMPTTGQGDGAAAGDPAGPPAFGYAAAAAAAGLAVAALLVGRFVKPATLRGLGALALIAGGWFALQVHPLALALLGGLAVCVPRGDGEDRDGRDAADGPDDDDGGRAPRDWRDGLLWFIGPVAACAVAMRVDLAAAGPAALVGWAVLLAIVIGDARALGAWLGGRTLGGRSTGQAVRLGVAACVGGPLPLVLATAASEAIGEAMLAAVVLAHLLVGGVAPLVMRWSWALWPGDRDGGEPPVQ